MSTEFIIYRKNAFDPANEVYFAYDVRAAFDLLDELEQKHPNVEWGIADVWSRKSKSFRLLRWLDRMLDD